MGNRDNTSHTTGATIMVTPTYIASGNRDTTGLSTVTGSTVTSTYIASGNRDGTGINTGSTVTPTHTVARDTCRDMRYITITEISMDMRYITVNNGRNTMSGTKKAGNTVSKITAWVRHGVAHRGQLAHFGGKGTAIRAKTAERSFGSRDRIDTKGSHHSLKVLFDITATAT